MFDLGFDYADGDVKDPLGRLYDRLWGSLKCRSVVVNRDSGDTVQVPHVVECQGTEMIMSDGRRVQFCRGLGEDDYIAYLEWRIAVVGGQVR